ncbi:hypothetical protein ACWGOE_07215 [Leucobacter chromiiresistens]
MMKPGTAPWLRTWWLGIPDPREISIAFTLAYIVALYTGAVTLVQPPSTVKAAIGPSSMAALAVLLVLGSLIAMLGGAREHWKLERIGLWFMAGATIIYGALVLGLHFETNGSRLTQLGFVTLALFLFIVRWVLIRYFEYRPRG